LQIVGAFDQTKADGTGDSITNIVVAARRMVYAFLAATGAALQADQLIDEARVV
jgi:hypothetical protein